MFMTIEIALHNLHDIINTFEFEIRLEGGMQKSFFQEPARLVTRTAPRVCVKISGMCSARWVILCIHVHNVVD